MKVYASSGEIPRKKHCSCCSRMARRVSASKARSDRRLKKSARRDSKAAIKQCNYK